jgi:hypothetical protein
MLGVNLAVRLQSMLGFAIAEKRARREEEEAAEANREKKRREKAFGEEAVSSLRKEKNCTVLPISFLSSSRCSCDLEQHKSST